MRNRKCCPFWAVLTVILILAAVAAFACLVLKKLHMLRRQAALEEGYWVEEPAEKTDDGGVRYTTDQDFV